MCAIAGKSRFSWIGRLALVTLVVVLSASALCLATDFIFQTGDVSTTSTGDMAFLEFTVTGLGSAQIAYVFITAWHMEFVNGAHAIKDMGIYIQKAVMGGWQWTRTDIPVVNGTARGRFLVYMSDVTASEDFSCKVQFLVMAPQ